MVVAPGRVGRTRPTRPFYFGDSMSEAATSNPVPYGRNRQICARCTKAKRVVATPDSPFGEFPESQKGGGPSSICTECHEAADAAKRIEKKRAKTRELFKQFVGAVNRQELGLPHQAELVVAMLKHFNGVEGLAAEWYGQIQNSDPGSKVRLDQYKAISILLKDANATIGNVNLDDLDDDQLEAAVRGEAAKLMLHEPDDYADPADLAEEDEDVA